MPEYRHGIEVDFSRDQLFDPLGLIRLRESYMRDDEVSPQERFAYVASAFGSTLEHAQRIYEYASKHWLSFATPILSFGRSKRGLPISCYLSSVVDTAEGLVDAYAETSWLSMMGGGVGLGFNIRSADDKSTGVMAHLKTYDASTLAYKQGNTRRGSYAAYLDISHPDILSFLEIRKPTGDQNLRCLNLHHGVCLSDAFMEIVERCTLDPNADDSWELKDPHNGHVREVVSAKHLWEKIVEIRMHTGEPFIVFIDTVNNARKQWQVDNNHLISQSNLCTEILQYTSADRTAVCCLSSLNAEYWDDWSKDERFIDDVMEFLDNVLQYFIDDAPDVVAKAKYAASMERSVGVGVLGLHALFQSKEIAFESVEAKALNIKLFKHIDKHAEAASVRLASERGEAPDAVGHNQRFTYKTAPAPNASSSLIVGNTSASVEPTRANIYRQDTLSGPYINKNKFLDNLILELSVDKPDGWYDLAWSEVLNNDGSVQNVKWLSDETKQVFKTAFEIDQNVIIDMAADRQHFIDQSQSINIFVRPTAHIKEVHNLHFDAWKKGVKTLYYLRSEKINTVEKVGKQVERERLDQVEVTTLEECSNCEG